VRLTLLTFIALLALGLAALKAFRSTGPDPETPRATAHRILAPYRSEHDSDAPPARPLFIDVAPALGLSFVHDNAARGAFRLPEEMGPGAGFLDHDGDGDLDVFLAGGGRLGEGEPVQTCRLYRNDGDAYTDVSAAAGADLPGHAMGIACADCDDDGDVDIFVSRVGPDALLRNRGDGTFEEVGPEAGLADPGFGASAAFLDFDRDGRLDLYVTRYVRWSVDRERPCYTILGVRDYCNPRVYGAVEDRLYRNRGDGTFEDVTGSSGIGTEPGNGLGVLAADFDDDGWIDVYVANDQTPAFLWHNNGDGTFTNVAAMSGCAYDARGVAIAGMGVASEDVDGDGDLDLLVTNIQRQSHLLLLNDGGVFDDVSTRAGLATWSTPSTGFGVALFDQDHDGALDAFFANGDVNMDHQLRVPENPYAQPDHFARLVDGAFTDATRASGVAFADVGRGVACADCDGDGDLDLLLANNGGPARLLRNEDDSGRSWLLVAARTGPGHRAALGARVTVHAGDRVITRQIRPQQSYLSSGDPRAHFGLGDAQRVDRIVIRWPNGSTSEHEGGAANRVVTIDQPAATEAGGP
jgi:hypothetical protein